jgi:3-methyladenine DNA glycosylase/8-oxoguanine DNA glycosylase
MDGDIYKAQSQLRSLKNKLWSEEIALDETLQEVELKEAELIQTVSPLLRAKLIEALVSLSAEIENKEAMIADLDDQIDQVSAELNHLQAHNSYQ